MSKPLFTGVCTALVTPFQNGRINYQILEQLLQRQIDAGISAIVIAGTTGESPTLSDEEKIELLKRSKNYVGDKCLIIAGTGSNNTEHSVKLSIAAEEAGADGLLIVSPYYNKATPEGTVLLYRQICSAVCLPVIIYNVPGRTGMDIPVSVYQSLSKVPNIVGVKEASTDITKIARIRNICGKDFSVWSGNDDQIVPAMALGSQGVISVLSNIVPHATKSICDAAFSADYVKAAALQCQYLPLIDFLFCEVNPIPVKALMKEMGYDCGGCRLPLCGLSEQNRQRISRFLR